MLCLSEENIFHNKVCRERSVYRNECVRLGALTKTKKSKGKNVKMAHRNMSTKEQTFPHRNGLLIQKAINQYPDYKSVACGRCRIFPLDFFHLNFFIPLFNFIHTQTPHFTSLVLSSLNYFIFLSLLK